MSSFYNNLKAVIPATELAQKGDLSYLSAANAIQRAGRPVFEFVEFNGKPMLEMLGGAVVAVDISNEDAPAVQRTWLPVMDQLNCPVPLAEMSLTHINNARQRCLVKALAMTQGVALSLFLGCDGNGEKAEKMLGILPDSNLETVQPVLAMLNDDEKGKSVPYIEWGVALAAARITDPHFFWSIATWEGMPYRVVLNNVMVDVDVVYKGVPQRISLPLMDSSHRALTAKFANVNDWNKTVMRALTKAIAFRTGYGLSVYAAEEFGAILTNDEAKVRPAKTQKAKEQKAVEPKAAAPAVSTERSEPVQAAPEPVASAPAQEPVVSTPVKEVPVESQKAVETPVNQPAPAKQQDAGNKEMPEFLQKFMASTMGRFEQAKVVGLISVFDALAKSVKWTPDEKLVCYSALLELVYQHITAEQIQLLLETLKHNPTVLNTLSQDRRDAICSKLVYLAMENAVNAENDEILGKLGDVIVSAKVAIDVSDMLRLAMLANVPQEWFEYYDACMMS